MDPSKFSPEQLELAMKLRALSVNQLAERLDVSRRSVSSYLNSSVEPSIETQAKMAEALEVPVAFLQCEPFDTPQVDAVSFRSLSRMKAADRHSAIGFGGIAFAFSAWMDARYLLPKPDVPDLQHETDPELAAHYVRQAWGWGEKPIPNMVHLLERQGVKVFSLAIQSLDVDAFSTWSGATPFVFLNTIKSGERSRFDAAHELAHLVLHRHGQLHRRNSEIDANAFASAFLMPASSIKANLPKNPSVKTLIDKKCLWGTSVAALAHRVYRVGRYTDWQYRAVTIELAKKGFRDTEPAPIERESSQILMKVLQMAREDGISRSQIAQHLSVATKDLDTLMFGLALSKITGGREESAESATEPPRPDLRVVSR